MIYRIEITPFRIESCAGPDSYRVGEHVIIRSKEGLDIGRIISITDDDDTEVYAQIERVASQTDFEKREELKQYEEKCLLELKRAVDEFKYSMKPVYAHCQFDEERVIFYFTAQKRLEFRKLHRFISQKLNKRVVIKQIGSRDYSKLFGGIGPCGRNLCCRTFLHELRSISLRMARDQKLYVSPGKISGICGRLLCCLNFEEDFYGGIPGYDYGDEEDEEIPLD